MINIIDGINGLSSSLCVLAALFFSYHAFLVGNDMVVFLNIVVMGSLIAFIYFNVFSDFTIYMGDHGAYILGFYLVIHCFWLLGDAETLMLRQFSPMMVFALFSYPFIYLLDYVFLINLFCNYCVFISFYLFSFTLCLDFLNEFKCFTCVTSDFLKNIAGRMHNFVQVFRRKTGWRFFLGVHFFFFGFLKFLSLACPWLASFLHSFCPSLSASDLACSINFHCANLMF